MFHQCNNKSVTALIKNQYHKTTQYRTIDQQADVVNRSILI